MIRAREDALVDATWRTIVAENAPASLEALARSSGVPIRSLRRYLATDAAQRRPIPIGALVQIVTRGLGVTMLDFWWLVEQRAARRTVPTDPGAPITPARDRRP